MTRGTGYLEGAKSGTALMLFDNPMFRELWGDLHVMAASEGPPIIDEPMSGPSRTLLNRAARRQALTLDMVAFDAASHTSFVTDSYVGLRSDDEVVLAAAVASLRAAYDSPRESNKGWSSVEAFLKTVKADE